MAQVREPTVAGSFYPGRREALLASLAECFLHQLGPGSLPKANPRGPGAIAALVCPHAGYMYSGPAAAHGFAALAADGIPECAVILGPSHRSLGRAAAVSLAESWRTPLGEVAVDTASARALTESTDLLVADEEAHRWEHSLEVQVPFLQFVYGERTPKIVPICIRAHPYDNLDHLIEDANQLGKVLSDSMSGKRAVVIASSDFSHQIPHASAVRQDKLALDRILALDPAGLLATVQEHQISTCGPVPVAIAIAYCQAALPGQGDGGKAELLCYYTSGDITGDRSAVVGYASVVIRLSGGEHR